MQPGPAGQSCGIARPGTEGQGHAPCSPGRNAAGYHSSGASALKDCVHPPPSEVHPSWVLLGEETTTGHINRH